MPRFGFLLLALLMPSCATSPIEQPDIYLVPLGRFSSALVSELADYYKQKFNLKVSLLPTIELGDRVIDQNRPQVIAEELIEVIKQKHEHLAANSRAIIIGLTSNDMYIRGVNWQFAFSFREYGKFAVVSCARMDPVNLGQGPDDNVLRSRLRKMVTKNVGILYFGHSQNDNPRSVLYSQILGVEELDAVGEDF
jgi:predicted Zn-dependent protease